MSVRRSSAGPQQGQGSSRLEEVLRAGQQARLFAPPQQSNAQVRALENQLEAKSAQLREVQRVADEERARGRESTYTMNQTLDKEARAHEIDQEAASNVAKDYGAREGHLNIKIETLEAQVKTLGKGVVDAAEIIDIYKQLMQTATRDINNGKYYLKQSGRREESLKERIDWLRGDVLKCAKERKDLEVQIRGLKAARRNQDAMAVKRSVRVTAEWEKREAQLKSRVADLEKMVAQQESFVQQMFPSSP